GFQAGKAEKSACPLDRMQETNDIAEQVGIVGALFELDQLAVENFETLRRFRQKFPAHVVHEACPIRRRGRPVWTGPRLNVPPARAEARKKGLKSPHLNGFGCFREAVLAAWRGSARNPAIRRSQAKRTALRQPDR